MKKIFIALAILAFAQVANAQSAKVAAAAKAVEAAKADSQNAKKNTKVATWLTLGNAYLKAYNAPLENVIQGTPKAQLQVMLGNERALSSQEVEIKGQTYTKDTYATKALYFDQNGNLAISEVLTPAVPGALDGAFDALKKAVQVDEKGSKTEDIKKALGNVVAYYNQDAMTYYNLGQEAKAADMFNKAFQASNTKPYSNPDYESLYYSGMMYQASENFAAAKKAYTDCKNGGYYGEDGIVYARLAEIAEKEGDKAAEKASYEEGFEKNPTSQAILIGLINYYIGSGEDTDRLFDLIKTAEKNEPTNASLVYVEGNIYKQLDRIDEAIAAYDKCSSMDPKYPWGHYAKASILVDEAEKVREKAETEFDNKKYEALVNEYSDKLKACIEPFEKVYEIADDEDLKSISAQYLKNISYALREQAAEYQAMYDKYTKILNGE